jgi:hypothetical protein
VQSAIGGAQLRQAAFEHVKRLAALNDGILGSADLAAGFEFSGTHPPGKPAARHLQGEADGRAVVDPNR